jgi:acyl dehydratase
VARYYDELDVGEVFVHPVRRTVTETDNLLITALTMNPQPLHLDEEAAARSPFGTRIVNSLLTLGLTVSLSVADLTLGTTIGNLGYEAVRFPAPVLQGDTLRAESEVLRKRRSESRTDAGIVWFAHRGFNQRDEAVCVCERAALMLLQPRNA